MIGINKYLIINTYFPCDMQRNGDYDELLGVLAEIRNIMKNKRYDVLIKLGDLNPSIERNTEHVGYVTNFFNKNNLTTVCDNLDYSCGDVTYPNKWTPKVIYMRTIPKIEILLGAR